MAKPGTVTGKYQSTVPPGVVKFPSQFIDATKRLSGSNTSQVKYAVVSVPKVFWARTTRLMGSPGENDVMVSGCFRPSGHFAEGELLLADVPIVTKTDDTLTVGGLT